MAAIEKASDYTWFRVVDPVFFPIKGRPIFSSAAEMLAYTDKEGLSAGEAALRYESELLGITEEEALNEMERRYEIMLSACEKGMSKEMKTPMQLLEPTAGGIFESCAAGRLAFSSIHTKAAARAMAVMHANNSMEVVCAAPTGGAAGALPGVIITLEEELRMDRKSVCLALFAAAAVGLVLDTRATFAAEVAGCQVEIGAGGAMGSAAAVQSAGGTPREALDAAAVSFQNTMGSVCDLVQGIVEIPCHTRNAVSASSAFVNADIVMGGYKNPVPLDETIDAVYSVGKMLPPELRCTSQGGLAVCPSALAIKKLR